MSIFRPYIALFDPKMGTINKGIKRTLDSLSFIKRSALSRAICCFQAMPHFWAIPIQVLRL